MQDGGLAGARFDGKIGNVNLKVSDLTDKVALSADNDEGLLAAMGHGEDVTTTEANEAGTHLKVAGNYYSIGTLLGTGTAEAVGSGTTIVDGARAALSSIRNEAALALNIFDEPGQASALRSALDDIWARARTEVGKVFPAAKVSLSANPRYSSKVLDDLDDRISALESEDAFAAATAKGGGGVFAGAALSAANAAKAFAASKTESKVALQGPLGEMRFGAVWRKTRGNATVNSPAVDQLGAFAYSMIDKETTGAQYRPRNRARVLRRQDAGSGRRGELCLRRHRSAGPLQRKQGHGRALESPQRCRWFRVGVPVFQRCRQIHLAAGSDAAIERRLVLGRRCNSGVRYHRRCASPNQGERLVPRTAAQRRQPGGRHLGVREQPRQWNELPGGKFRCRTRGRPRGPAAGARMTGTGALSTVLPNMDIAANPDKRGQTIASGNLKIIGQNFVFDPTGATPNGARVVMAEDANTSARESEANSHV